MNGSGPQTIDIQPAPRGADDLAGMMQNKCVLEICRVPFVGGAERIALNAAQVVQDAGGRVIVACPPGGQMQVAAVENGLECRPIQALSGRHGIAADFLRGMWATVHNSRALTALVAREPIDIIHAHHPIGAFQAVRATGRARPRLVLHVHETLPAPRQYLALGGWLRERCDAFICVSDAGRHLLRRMGMPEEKIHLVYNAVEPAFFTSPEPADLGRGPHIGIFGVLEPRKGHAELITAVARLAGSHPDVQLWIVGELSYAKNSAYLDYLKALAAEWHVEDRVHFLGYRKDIPQLMAAMDVVTLASREMESLPTVLLEAAALGRVSVATEVGGVREIIEDGRTGLVVSPNNALALTDALKTALSPASARLGQAARARAQTRFSSERFARDLLGAFGEVLRTEPATAH